MNRTLRRGLALLLFCASLAVVAFLYFHIVKDLHALYLERGMRDNFVRDYFNGYGAWGMLALGVLQALQMVIVFMPAEFVQIPAALAYPLWVMMPVCLLGVVLGSSVIYFLAKVLHVRMDYFERRIRRIDDIVASFNPGTSTRTIMHVLFITPFVPYGAVCYYAAASNIKFRHYIGACLTGVLPPVLVSYVVGAVCGAYLHDPVRMAVSLVLTLAAVCLISYLALDALHAKYFSRTRHPRPNALFYHFFCVALWPIYRLRSPYFINRRGLKGIKGPAVVIAPHTSFSDFAYVAFALYPHRVTFVMNRVYFSKPILRFLFRFLRPIPKKLFCPDTNTIRSVYAARRNKAIIAIFPEGRLSTDGRSYPPATGTPELLKKLGLNVYLLSCDGAYLVRPKWSKQTRKGPIHVTSQKLFDGADLATMDISVISDRLTRALSHNDENAALNETKYVCTDMAEGLDGILYRCPKCKREFTLRAKGNRIACSCGFSATLDQSYRLHGAPYERISEWYEDQKRDLKEKLYTETFAAPVRAVTFENNVRAERGDGVCFMDADTFRYESDTVSFSLPTASLGGMPFTCGSEIGIYYHNVLYYFYMKETPNQCVKWSMFVDLCVQEARATLTSKQST